MLFVYPHLLWLLLLAPALGYLGYRAGGPRRWLTASLRAAAVAALVLALARPVLPWRSTDSTTVMVLDVSPSAPTTLPDDVRRALAGPVRPIVIAFASRATVVADPSKLTDPAALAEQRHQVSNPLWADDVSTGGSNLAAALQLAGGQIPADGRGAVKLYADGGSDHGDAAAEGHRLANRGIAVDVVPTIDLARDLPPMLVQQVTLPATGRVGQTADAVVQVDSTVAGKAIVTVTAGSAGPARVTANVAPGCTAIHVRLPLATAGLIPVRAAVRSTDDKTPTDGDAVLAAVDVQPAPRVLLVQDVAEPGLAEALAAVLGPSARVTPVSPDQLADRSMDDVGAVVLADVPADHLPAAAQAQVRRAVLDGVGLLVAGATRSFGPGGYDDSALAPLLPVRMPQQAESIDPSTTLVIIIDTSGSMHGDRIDLAKEVARLAVSHLRPQDKVGIVEFYGGRRWAAPIQSAANRSVIDRTLDRMTAGGGTVLYPAVEEAAFALKNVHTRSKHVFIISDGGVEEAPFGALVRQMADDGVAVTTVKVGDDDTPNPMASIARWGEGRYYDVQDQFALPDITLKQPQLSLLSPVVRSPAELVAGTDPLVRSVIDGGGGVADQWGSVGGYVRTAAKPTADVLLRTAGGDPLLARWRYGAGFVATLTTQLGSGMTQGLQDRSPFARLMAALIRQADASRGVPLQVKAVVRPAGVEVDVVATDADSGLSARPLSIALTDEHGRPCRPAVVAEAIGAGHWNVLLPGVTAGAYEVTATVDTATGHAGVAVAPPAPARSVDRPLLDRLAAFSPLAGRRAAQLPADRLTFVALQPPLVVAAVVLLLLNVAARRWPLNARRTP